MGKILTDYHEALEKYGRPRGPFEVGREYPYDATSTAKSGPRVDLRHRDHPAAEEQPDRWWD